MNIRIDKIKILMLIIIIFLLVLHFRPFGIKTRKMALNDYEMEYISSSCILTKNRLPIGLRFAFNDDVNKNLAEKHEKKFFNICKKYITKELNSLERFSTVEAQRKAREKLLFWNYPEKELILNYVNGDKELEKLRLEYFIKFLRNTNNPTISFRNHRSEFTEKEQKQIKEQLGIK